jgi:hypothetical protein
VVTSSGSQIEQKLRAICASEIMRVLTDDADIDLPVYPWVTRISEEIAADILRNFYLAPKGEEPNCYKPA